MTHVNTEQSFREAFHQCLRSETAGTRLKDAAINRDRNLRLQYLAGMGLNLRRESEIYNHMTAFGPHLSPNVFRGSDEILEYIERAIESGSSR